MNTESIPNTIFTRRSTEEQLREQLSTQTNEVEPGLPGQLDESMQSNPSRLSNNLVAEANTNTFTNAALVLPVISTDRAQNFPVTAGLPYQSRRPIVHQASATSQLKDVGPSPIPLGIGVEQNIMSSSDAQGDLVQPNEDDVSQSQGVPIISHASVGTDKNKQQEDLREISKSKIARQEAQVENISQELSLREKKFMMSLDQHYQDDKKAREAGQPIPQLRKEPWEALTKSHKELMDMYYTFFEQSFVLGGTKNLRNAHKLYGMTDRMNRNGIRGYFRLLREHIQQDNVKEHAHKFIACLEDHFSKLKVNVPGDKNLPRIERVAPDLDLLWIEFLGDINRFHIGLLSDKSDETERISLSHAGTLHYQEAVARIPTRGRFIFNLYRLADDSIERLGLIGKSLSTAEPYLRARLKFLKTEIAYQQRSGLPLGAALARIQGALLSGRVVNDKDVETFIRELKRTMEEESQDFRRLGPHLALALLAGVVGFGAEDSHILHDLVPRNKNGTSRLASALSLPEPGGRPPLLVAHFLACIAFKEAVDYFINAEPLAGSIVLPFVHVYMKYFQGTMLIETGQATARQFIQPNIAVMLNRLVEQQQQETARPLDKNAGGLGWLESESRFVRVSNLLPAVAPDQQIAAEPAPFLPEDLVTFGAVWDATPPDSRIFTQVRKYLAGKLLPIPELEPSPEQDHARRERILAVAVQLAKNDPSLDFDAQSSRFCVQDMGGKSDPNRIAN